MAATLELARPLTSTEPILHCSDSWHAWAAKGTILPNRPVQEATWSAIRSIECDLLRPLQDRFGMVTLTFGFASAELVKVIRKRAAEGGWLPGVSPENDQHAGHELNARGNRICKHGGIAVDLRVPGISSEIVARWTIDHLPFDAIYLYDPNRPFHLSWARNPRRMVVRMVPRIDRGFYPKTVKKGRGKVGRAH